MTHQQFKKQIKEISDKYNLKIKKISCNKKADKIDLEINYFYNLNFDHPVRQFIIWKLDNIDFENSKLYEQLIEHQEKINQFQKEVLELKPEYSEWFESSDYWFIPNRYLFIQ